MIRLLPFVLIPILIIAGLGYWRYSQTKQVLTSPKTDQTSSIEPVEVPKTLPTATIDERVKALEDTISKLVPQVNNLKLPATSADAKTTDLEAAITDLKARVSVLEKSSPSCRHIRFQTAFVHPFRIWRRALE